MTTAQEQHGIGDLEQDWLEARRYAQTHAPGEILDNAIRVVADALRTGEIDVSQADACLRVFLSEYVAIVASEQINDYMERHFSDWSILLPAQGSRRRDSILA